MKKIQSRFGEVEFDPKSAIYFPDGLIGFENLRKFIVMPSRKEGPLFWIQSVDDSEIAFVVTDPTNFFPDYNVAPDAGELARLEASTLEDCHTLSIVTVSDAKTVTLNLAAPILFSPKSQRAIQVILEDSQYQVKTPLPEV